MQIYFNKKNKKKVAHANILIAQGFWQNDIFNRTVILVLDNDEHGSTGIILNKINQLKVNAVFPQLNINNLLFYGGPFNDDWVGFIHDYPYLEDAIAIGDGLYWCGDMEDVKKRIDDHTINPERIKFFTGFVQWAPGQLYKEIKQNKWWINTLSINDILKVEAGALWAYSLIKGGNAYGLFHSIADPVLN